MGGNSWLGLQAVSFLRIRKRNRRPSILYDVSVRLDVELPNQIDQVIKS